MDIRSRLISNGMQKGGGYLVISLDFELHWGMFDKVTIEEYGEHYKGVHKVLPEILATFAEHDIHATWASVGMLMTRNKNELLDMLPRDSHRPHYPDPRISAYHHIDTAHIGKDEKDDPHHFAPSLVRDIIDTPGQELGSHTFSHFYCIDGKGNKPSVFRADLELQREISAAYGVTPTSIVFPRNQATEEALIEASKYGITAFRGNQEHKMYQPRAEDKQSLFLRAMRLLDAYCNISGHNTVPLSYVASSQIHDIPASRFLRPYSRQSRFLERMHLRRIKKSMTHAAKNNEIFHLWWHPHNFGVHQKENMAKLHDLLAHFAVLRETYGMESRNMGEIAAVADATWE